MNMLFNYSPFFARGGAPKLNVADVFSTDLYTGNGETQTITNGIDLAGEGGLVWIKARAGPFAGDTTFGKHVLVDTQRGTGRSLFSSTTEEELVFDTSVSNFASSGFSVAGGTRVNDSSSTFAAWTFRQAPKFFDVVTYTGDGISGRTIAHNLGVVPGMIVVKRRDGESDWPTYHRSNTADPETDYLLLNKTNATADNPGFWNDTAPTATHFTVGSGGDVNSGFGYTYVAYLFAHDPDPSGVIQCGSYEGNGSETGPVITLGWEPQWAMFKRTDSTGNWYLFDATRSGANQLFVNRSDAEYVVGFNIIDFLSTGFQIKSSSTGYNASGGTYVYAAIRAEGT